ncbi:unnamed protein product [Tenebrio molitor]|nr:unnamed protein product [Tenebrio molitor]
MNRSLLDDSLRLFDHVLGFLHLWSPLLLQSTLHRPRRLNLGLFWLRWRPSLLRLGLGEFVSPRLLHLKTSGRRLHTFDFALHLATVTGRRRRLEGLLDPLRKTLLGYLLDQFDLLLYLRNGRR